MTDQSSVLVRAVAVKGFVLKGTGECAPFGGDWADVMCHPCPSVSPIAHSGFPRRVLGGGVPSPPLRHLKRLTGVDV